MKTATRNCYAGGHEHYKTLEPDGEMLDPYYMEAPKSSLSIRSLLELYHMGRCHTSQNGSTPEGDDALDEIVSAIEQSCSLSRVQEEERLIRAFQTERAKYHGGISAGQTLKEAGGQGLRVKGSDEEELTASGICAIILAWTLQQETKKQ